MYELAGGASNYIWFVLTITVGYRRRINRGKQYLRLYEFHWVLWWAQVLIWAAELTGRIFPVGIADQRWAG